MVSSHGFSAKKLSSNLRAEKPQAETPHMSAKPPASMVPDRGSLQEIDLSRAETKGTPPANMVRWTGTFPTYRSCLANGAMVLKSLFCMASQQEPDPQSGGAALYRGGEPVWEAQRGVLKAYVLRTNGLPALKHGGWLYRFTCKYGNPD